MTEFYAATLEIVSGMTLNPVSDTGSAGERAAWRECTAVHEVLKCQRGLPADTVISFRCLGRNKRERGVWGVASGGRG